ncbi:putative saf4/Yju2 protein [Helianthus annuus]|nr:putative saf4/Yju2 protein [Helianthus annuus]
MIAKGVRFNAEKKLVGNYYSTKIWSFTMKSACCQHEIVIQTDQRTASILSLVELKRKLKSSIPKMHKLWYSLSMKKEAS